MGSLKTSGQISTTRWGAKGAYDFANKQENADGVSFNIRLKEERQCILVLMGARADGTKELLELQDGYRESEQSGKEILVDIKRRGLTVAPRLAIGDGSLGFWAALRKVFPTTRE